MFVALGSQREMRMLQFVICGLCDSTTFLPYYFITGTIFERKKTVIEHKMCVLSFCRTSAWNISIYKKNWARYDRKFTSILVFK